MNIKEEKSEDRFGDAYLFSQDVKIRINLKCLLC
jgi:hypothetical protein